MQALQNVYTQQVKTLTFYTEFDENFWIVKVQHPLQFPTHIITNLDTQL